MTTGRAPCDPRIDGAERTRPAHLTTFAQRKAITPSYSGLLYAATPIALLYQRPSRRVLPPPEPSDDLALHRLVERWGLTLSGWPAAR